MFVLCAGLAQVQLCNAVSGGQIAHLFGWASILDAVEFASVTSRNTTWSRPLHVETFVAGRAVAVGYAFIEAVRAAAQTRAFTGTAAVVVGAGSAGVPVSLSTGILVGHTFTACCVTHEAIRASGHVAVL